MHSAPQSSLRFGYLISLDSAVVKALALALAMQIAAVLQFTPAHAQAMRTYVSGTGRDSNPCTRSAPCQTLQAALKLTTPGGEIQSLDSADYGYVTITQAVTIIGAHGATGAL